jgi:membrane protease YdiL (CAAX protease family)
LTHSTAGWHLIAGAAVVFGSYFLFILGPRSLASEGQALWMALTWPRGLEELLKAKARLWWMVSLVVVGLVLLFAVLRYPADSWRVGIVGVLWGVFGRSLAEKAVTLVHAPSTSGEPEPAPRGRRWAASLGTFSFGAGILSQRWHLAVVGIVYSYLTAAAMWQQFRARLPYLFDPWAEPAPKFPSLVNAMVAIAALTEGMAVMLAILLGLLGPQRLFIAQFVAYGICGLAAWLVTSLWLDGRGVGTKDIWRWPDVPLGARRLLLGGAAGLGLGAALGLAGIAWGALVQRIPDWGPALRAAGEHLAAHPGERMFVAVGAIAFAPLAEEYLFRGLLFRALDREWGGATAIWGSACFFAVYHPPVAWPPVVLVGAAAAVLFRRTGHLLPAVVLHAVYNAIVVLAK